MNNPEDLLARLGQRVRDERLALGLTAKEAAERAGLSRRFFGQLEHGAANIAVGRLAKVAEVLETSLVALLSDTERPSPPRRNRIGLLGLRGAGKSSVGPRLALRRTLPFVELDQRIEEAAGLSVATVFELHGESAYREHEARCLEALVEEDEVGVVALSGGVVLNPRALKVLFRGFTTVWLRASPEDHMNRVLAQGDTRPMANRENAMAELRALLQSREALYAAADIRVETSAGHDLDGVVDAICQALDVAV